MPDEIQMEKPDEQDRQAVGAHPHNTKPEKFTMGARELLPVKGPDLVECEAECPAAGAANEIGDFRCIIQKEHQAEIYGEIRDGTTNAYRRVFF